MGKGLRIACIAILLQALTAGAQQPVGVDIGEFSFLGRLAPSPRAAAMGVSGVALASDGSSLLANPAGLAAVRRFELSTTIRNDRLAWEAEFFGETTIDDAAFTGIPEFTFVLPVPTYRGALAFAVGYHRERAGEGLVAYSGFNDTYDPENPGAKTRRETERIRLEGGPGIWSVGCAVDLSPKATLGFALDVWGGEESMDRTFELGFDDEPDENAPPYIRTEESESVNYSGLGVRAGLLFRPATNLRIGVTVEAPFSIEFTGTGDSTGTTFDREGDVTDSESLSYLLEDEVTLPFSVGAGVAASAGLATITADIRLTDWPSLRYPALPVTEDAPYRTGLEWGGGIEVGIPGTSLRGRAGYRHEDLPYEGYEAIAGRDLVSAGIGWIMDGTMSVDMAATVDSRETGQADGQYVGRESWTRISLGMAYRF